MKVILKVSGSFKGLKKIGDVIDLPAQKARDLIERGLAEGVAEPAKAKAKKAKVVKEDESQTGSDSGS